ncbi:YjbH domain-containing protein [Rhodohalobacter sp. SW132]|uniref:YjbH domain-containing protein n=1 Tax=Rhodohalobacter sp. SW132 TaxID=2293433 RepID=UPI001314F620|nr:YjbH domain-containing protein [Rhodohalobacter sp. SW132]
MLFLPGAAQPQSLAGQLTEHGFENVTVMKTGAHLFVAYENRIYRSEAEALANVLTFAGRAEVSADSLTVIIRQSEVPVLAVITSISSLDGFLNGGKRYEAWLDATEITLHTRSLPFARADGHRTVRHRTRFRPVFPVGLGMRYQLGNYNEPYRFAFDLEPEIALPLGRGFTANARLAVPLYNNFDDNTYIRPALATLSRHFTLDEGLHGAVSAGIFGRNRAGVHSAIKAFLYQEIFSLTLDAGYTRFTSFTGEVNFPITENRPYSFYTLSADYRWRSYDLNIRAQYGRFLYDDFGTRVQVHRHFSEVEFGFFGINTRLGSNFGFYMSLPLSPRKYRDAGPVRIRPAPRFPIAYRYQGNDFRARTYETGIRFEEQLMQVYPSFIKNELKRFF